MKALPSLVMALGYLALIVIIMYFCADRTDSFDEFSQYWGLFGMVVGVATGAIPAFFFQSHADRATEAAAAAEDRAAKANAKAELYAALASPEKVEEILRDNPALFN